MKNHAGLKPFFITEVPRTIAYIVAIIDAVFKHIYETCSKLGIKAIKRLIM